MADQLTPYAKAHLRLLEIHRRWKTVRARMRASRKEYRIRWLSAADTGATALIHVDDDQVLFDMLVHNHS